MFTTSSAYDDTIRISARIPFTLSKIKKLAVDARILRDLAFDELGVIYPETLKGSWYYCRATKTIEKTVKEK